MRIFVIGAGSWGLVLARIFYENGNDVLVWTRRSEKKRKLEKERYEKGIAIPRDIGFTVDIGDFKGHDACVVVVPSFAFEDVIRKLSELECKVPVLIATKGISRNGELMGQILVKYLSVEYAVVSGPNIAIEIAQGKPASTVVASESLEVAYMFQKLLFRDYFRPYVSEDVVGVQVGGALKNVYAIASGIAEALELGINARASLITRATVEMMRLGRKLGADPTTFSGLSGVGDLVATAFSENSRNHFVGYMLGKGRNLHEIRSELDARNMVAEGIETTFNAYELSRKLDVSMPILETVYMILKGRMTAEEGLRKLMLRPLKKEFPL